jgi:hypothetical protein
MRNGLSLSRIALGRYPIRDKPCVFLAFLWTRSCGPSAPGRVAHWARTNGATMGNRELPDEFGKWNSVFKRFRRWVKADAFHRLFKEVASDAGLEYAMIPSRQIAVQSPAGQWTERV